MPGGMGTLRIDWAIKGATVRYADALITISGMILRTFVSSFFLYASVYVLLQWPLPQPNQQLLGPVIIVVSISESFKFKSWNSLACPYQGFVTGHFFSPDSLVSFLIFSYSLVFLMKPISIKLYPMSIILVFRSLGWYPSSALIYNRTKII